MAIIYHLFLVFFLLFNFLLCALILAQESKSMGLGASLGGDASSSVFGTSTAGVLKTATAWGALIFVSACLIISVWTASLGKPQHLPVVAPVSEQQP